MPLCRVLAVELTARRQETVYCRVCGVWGICFGFEGFWGLGF